MKIEHLICKIIAKPEWDPTKNTLVIGADLERGIKLGEFGVITLDDRPVVIQALCTVRDAAEVGQVLAAWERNTPGYEYVAVTIADAPGAVLS